MFAPRRLCVYPPPLLAPPFPSVNSFVSPTYTKFARNSFVSPTYANTGGWGPKNSTLRPTTLKCYFQYLRLSPSPQSHNRHRFNKLPKNVGAPTFSHRESRVSNFGVCFFSSSTVPDHRSTSKCRRADIPVRTPFHFSPPISFPSQLQISPPRAASRLPP